jgi:DNA polymerase I-like protein with 3'-5' exonuclease and polymerase domains
MIRMLIILNILTGWNFAQNLSRQSVIQMSLSLPQLFQALSSLSLTVSLDAAGAPRIVGDVGRLTDEIKHSLREHRGEFIALLGAETQSINDVSGKVSLSNHDFAYASWRSRERLASPIAIDCETELIDGHQVPRLALVSVSDGTKHRLIQPDQLDEFISQHADRHFIAHNAAFDFAVLRKSLRSDNAWLGICNEGRLHDTMILDALIRLARSDEEPTYRDLGTVVRAYLEIDIDKNDPYRLRYTEIIGKSWETVDPGFFQYAIKDAIVTWKLYQSLTAIAATLMKPFSGDLLEGSRQRFGLLTESLQVRAAIAIAEIERTGLSLDRHQVALTRRSLEVEVAELVRRIRSLPEVDGLFKLTRSGDLSMTPSGKPSINHTRLAEVLEQVATTHGFAIPRTEKSNKITTSLKEWGQHIDCSPFLSMWVRLETIAKLCQFLSGLNSDRIHPRYRVIVRTGRTSCSGPNIQQLPRAGGFREMVIPSPGHYLLSIDYSAVELRTLAAICEQRFGQSRLADVFRQGIDPHKFTAAMFEGISQDEFDSLPNRKELRQQAKALNFGIPGGLGAQSLVAYANATYGVSLTIEQAQRFRQRLVEEVYPELSSYLHENLAAILAGNLRATEAVVRGHFDSDSMLGAAKRIVMGKGKADGGDYGEAFVDRAWNALQRLNQNKSLQGALAQRRTGQQLAQQLFHSSICTLTGRVRGSVGFSQARNTPFQGLAADGAKLALWNLYQAGYRVVAFVHDEVLVEIPKRCDLEVTANEIDRILCESMEEFTGNVPVTCEFALSDRWSKQAEAVFDESGRLQVWSPR